MSLGDVFSIQVIGDLAGQCVYERGVGYHAGGRVEPGDGSDQRMSAVVRGTIPYTVELWVERGRPAWSCTCPYAEDGAFCKHCVAVGLLFLEGPAPFFAFEFESEDREREPDVSAHVAGLSHERLVEVVLEQCESDWRLRERMIAEASAARGDGPDVAAWQSRIESVFDPYDDFVSYREAPEWASDINDVIGALSDLVDAGHPEDVILLVEHAHRCADAAIEYVDSSSGEISFIEERLIEVHLAACEAAHPDPMALAQRLVDLELTSELDGFHRAALTYADVLGEEGVAEYRRLVAPRWDAVADSTDRWSGSRFAVEQAMIGVALASRDPDELIAIKAGNLHSPGTYLEICEALADAGRIDEALEWSRKGMEEFADSTYQLPPLRDFLASILRSRGEDAEAVELYWVAFVAVPSLSTYQRLRTEAGPDAEAWSRRSIEALRNRTADLGGGGDTAVSPGAAVLGTVLVQILMYEGDIEDAWTVAVQYGCDTATQLSLARAREKDHPLDAIPVYERAALEEIDQKKNHAYKVAVDLLDRIRILADRAGQPELFTTILERVRTEHRAKRNLKKLLDGKGW
jgi:uncharacterized Zn finger protein